MTVPQYYKGKILYEQIKRQGSMMDFFFDKEEGIKATEETAIGTLVQFLTGAKNIGDDATKKRLALQAVYEIATILKEEHTEMLKEFENL